jgi:hypothetical protein
MPMRRFSTLARGLVIGGSALIAAVLSTPGVAQVSGQRQPFSEAELNFTLLTVRATECGFLAPWEEAVIHARDDWIARDLAEEKRVELKVTMYLAAVVTRYTTPCNDPGMARWVWATRAFGIFLGDYLPPHLLLFRSLALMEPPAALFLEAAGDVDYDATVAAIDAALARFNEDRLLSFMLDLSENVAEDGIWVEGPETSRAIADSLASLLTLAAAGDADESPLSEVSASRFITHIATVVTLWVADGCPVGVMEPPDPLEAMPPRVEYLGLLDCPGASADASTSAPSAPPAVSPETSHSGIFDDLPPSPAFDDVRPRPTEEGVLELLRGDDD